MLFEIVNPSDPYTFEAENVDIACVAVLFLGNGAYGLNVPDGQPNPDCPMFLFGGDPAAWAEKRLGCSLNDYLTKHGDAIASALDSVLIGDFSDRQIFNDAVAKMNEVGAVQFKNQWHDKKRSSLSDIGKRAWALAKALREPKSVAATS